MVLPSSLILFLEFLVITVVTTLRIDIWVMARVVGDKYFFSFSSLLRCARSDYTADLNYVIIKSEYTHKESE